VPAEAIVVSPTVTVPAAAQSWRAVRSSGPGGQNVNKVASKVELRVDVAAIEGLREDARQRLSRAIARRRDAEGLWLVTSQLTRDQGRNLEDAREKVRETIARALVAPRPRRPTRASAASRERRLQRKREVAQRKRGRGRVRGED
jgi:ribosome-associated protein